MVVQSQFIEMFGKTKQVSIGSLFDTTSGGTPSRTKNSYYDGGNIPWLTSSEVGQGLIKKTESFITEDGLKNSSAKWVPKYSVVVAMYGATVGKVGLLEIPCTTNQAVCSILPNANVIPTFLLYAVKNKEEWMISQAAGAAQPNISQAVIRKMEIPMPSKEEQIAFVEIAKQADKSKFDGFKSQFISQFGNNESNPMGFMKKPISEVATLINGRAYSANELLKSGKYRVLRVGNFFSTSDYYYSDLELEPNKYCEKGDLLYAWSATFGARIWEEERVIYHYHIWKVEYDNQLLDKEFLCFLLNEMTENLKHETHGSTMMHLTKEGMERKQIIIPPIGVQKSFVLFLHQADKSKYLN